MASATINLRMCPSASCEMADNGLLAPETAAACQRQLNNSQFEALERLDIPQSEAG